MKTSREEATGEPDNHPDRDFLNQSCGYSSGIMDADEAYCEIIYDKAKQMDSTLDFIGWLSEHFMVTKIPTIVIVEDIESVKK